MLWVTLFSLASFLRVLSPCSSSVCVWVCLDSIRAGLYTILYDGDGHLQFGFDSSVIKRDKGRVVVSFTPSANLPCAATFAAYCGDNGMMMTVRGVGVTRACVPACVCCGRHCAYWGVRTRFACTRVRTVLRLLAPVCVCVVIAVVLLLLVF